MQMTNLANMVKNLSFPSKVLVKYLILKASKFADFTHEIGFWVSENTI